jgi:hypothetical protein
MNVLEEEETPPSWMQHDWADVQRVARYLREDERRILCLCRMGKTPSDVARIFCLPSRQLADKEIRRTWEVARFYARWLSQIRRVGQLNLSVERQRLLEMFVLQRMSYVDVAAVLGVGRFEIVRRLRMLLDHLREYGYAGIADMLSDTWSNRRLRVSMRGAAGNRIEWKGKRRAMVMTPWRYDLRNMLLGMIGKVDYEWGAQQITWPSGSGVADCSGLVIECLKRVGRLPVKFRDLTAQGLRDYFKPVKTAQLCDLVFYGQDASVISHVMFYLGKGQIPEGSASEGMRKKECVIGMCNGAKDMVAQDAILLGAGLYIRTTPRYRKDFLTYGGIG